MKQYIDLMKRIIDEGEWVTNERTGKRCLTVINADLEYDVGNLQFPLVTTRKSFYKAAIAELLGYIRGYDNANQFAEIGAKSWIANANNPEWLKSPYWTEPNCLGRVYGVQLRTWNNEIDQLKNVIDNLSKGIDNRGEIMTMWNPAEHDQGCLRACMHTHTFSLVGGTLHLTSYQRSCDVPLGLNWNMVQCYVLLALVAQITGHKAGKVYHKIVNAHIYEDQLEKACIQIERTPFPEPELVISEAIKSLDDLETWVTTDEFRVINYQHREAIQYAFSV